MTATKEKVKQKLVERNTLLTENSFKERAAINDAAMRQFERMEIIEPWIFKDDGSSRYYFSAKTADRIRLMQTYLIGLGGETKNLKEAHEKACQEIE